VYDSTTYLGASNVVYVELLRRTTICPLNIRVIEKYVASILVYMLLILYRMGGRAGVNISIHICILSIEVHMYMYQVLLIECHNMFMAVHGHLR
jgi:hypothetical protein